MGQVLDSVKFTST